MKIYTSYFGNWSVLQNNNIKIISIALHPPLDFINAKLIELAPTQETRYKLFISKDEYIKSFKAQLSLLDFSIIYKKIENISDGKDVALLCYEKPDDICHRHLVADWLNSNLSYKVKEYKNKKIKNIKGEEK